MPQNGLNLEKCVVTVQHFVAFDENVRSHGSQSAAHVKKMPPEGGRKVNIWGFSSGGADHSLGHLGSRFAVVGDHY